MKKKRILFLLFLINQINIFLCKKERYKGVYRINTIINDYSFTIDNDNLILSNKKEGKEINFRIIPSKSNFYYIEEIEFNKRLGVNDKNELIFLEKNNSEIMENSYWNIIKLNKKEVLIQNIFNKNFIEYENIYLKCFQNLTEFIKKRNYKMNNISNSFKFSFFKLYEEVELNPEFIPLIDKEPIDIVIKYIDLTDKSLNREGIKQTNRDIENEELRYSVRSILENIPWIRKIFILMPNEKVKYFKSIDEIKNKIIYIKDKDLLGFDSSDSHTFQFNLFNMEKFGLSENFILMDDDYFFGKPINKSQFFYYDKKQKKVLPSIISDKFNEILRNETLKEYNKLFDKRYTIKPYSLFCFKLQQLASLKLLLEQYDFPLISVGFTHNAIPLNINDLKEIYELIKNKYQFTYDVLFSKERSIFGLQSHTLFNCYALNIKKRKVNSIPYGYYDIGNIEDKDIDIEMFVINNSGGSLYDKEEFEKEKIILEKKFSKATPYEIILDKIYTNEINSDEFIKNNKISEKFKENNELNKTITIIDSNNREKKEKEKGSIMIFTLVLLFFLIIIFIYIINLTYFISSSNNVANKSAYSSYIIDNSKNNTINKKIKKKYAEDEGALFN